MLISCFPTASPLLRRINVKAAASRTQRIMESISVNNQVGGAGGASSYNALKKLDNLLTNLCSPTTALQMVTTYPGSTSDQQIDMFDVLVCGGTLGIFVALALCSKGLRVGIVERNLLKGREQEWNISQKELTQLIEIGILGEDDAQDITQVKFNPNRCGFEGKGEIWVEDILNLGISDGIFTST